MKKSFYIFILLFVANLLISQVKSDNFYHPPRIDSSYNFAYEIFVKNGAPRYEYYYSSKTDTLTFVRWIKNKRTFLEIKLTPKEKDFLIQKGIKASEKIKIDTTHLPVEHEFSIDFQITHNFINKSVSIRDKYYFDKIHDFLSQFNKMLPKNAQFPIDSISFNEDKTTSFKSDTTFTVDLDYYIDSLHNKDKFLISYASEKPLVKLSYYDIYENRRRFGDSVFLKNAEIKILQKKSIAYINQFYYQNNSFKRTNDNFEMFSISYSIPGLVIETRINSIEMAKKDQKTIEFLNFLNPLLDKKHQFE